MAFCRSPHELECTRAPWAYACSKNGLRSTIGQPMPGRLPHASLAKPASWTTSLAPGAMPSAGSCTIGPAKLSPVNVPATWVPCPRVSHSVAAMPPAHSAACRKLTAITLRCSGSTTTPPLHTFCGGRPRAVSRKKQLSTLTPLSIMPMTWPSPWMPWSKIGVVRAVVTPDWPTQMVVSLSRPRWPSTSIHITSGMAASDSATTTARSAGTRRRMREKRPPARIPTSSASGSRAISPAMLSRSASGYACTMIVCASSSAVPDATRSAVSRSARAILCSGRYSPAHAPSDAIVWPGPTLTRKLLCGR